MNLQQKVMNAFIGKVVRKDLAFLVKGGLPVPTYVLEYLLGQYCASDDEQVINEGLEKVKQVIKNNYVHRAEAESVKGISLSISVNSYSESPTRVGFFRPSTYIAAPICNTASLGR